MKRWIVLLCLAATAGAQTRPPARRSQPAAARPTATARTFVSDVVKSALATPVADQQDRLRVLSTAIGVVSPIDPKLAASLAKEATEVELQLIARNERPAVSALAEGAANCRAATTFVQQIYPQSVALAEQSLIAAVTRCPKQTLEIIRSRVEAALDQHVVAPRLLQATMDAAGQDTQWSQDQFAKLFSALPEPREAAGSAPALAALFEQMAKHVGKDDVAKAGIQFLGWLDKLEESPERTMAVNITVGALRDTLGDEAYQRVLERDVNARQVASRAGEPAELTPESDAVSSTRGAESPAREAELKDMPPASRAREAAATAFALSAKDKRAANRFFDIAFAAVDEAWADRGSGEQANQATHMVEEVAEAAAQVDRVSALERAQGLQEPAARAIAMLGVARVAANHSTNK